MNSDEIANKLKRPIVARSAKLERELLARYGDVWRAARDDLAAIARDSAEARQAGSTLAAVKLAQTSRIDAAVGQVESQISLIADMARREITDAQIDAVLAGHVNAEQLIETVLGPVPEGAVGYQPQFPAGAFREIVGFSADGKPLGDLLATLGGQAAQDIRRKLTVAVALGRNPRVTAASIRASLGGNAARALTIARTEQLRAYREAARQTYAANKDVVQGWQWTAQLDSRTCAVCVAMHGEMFETEDSLDSHPNCRCTMTPVTRGWAELLGDEFADVPDTRVTMEPGQAWFARQPESLQQTILGPGKLRLYQEGRVDLPDLIRQTRHPRWGSGRRQATLAELGGVPQTRASVAARRAIEKRKQEYLAAKTMPLRPARARKLRPAPTAPRPIASAEGKSYQRLERMPDDSELRVGRHDWHDGPDVYRTQPGTAFRHRGVNVFVEDGGPAPAEVRQQLEARVSQLPARLRGKISEVRVHSGASPADAYYSRLGRKSQALAQAGEGRITFWGGRGLEDYASTFDHEAAHLLTRGGGPPQQAAWKAAQAADRTGASPLIRDLYGDSRLTRSPLIGSDSVTSYGGTHIAEDWAESVSMFLHDRQHGSLGTVQLLSGETKPVRFAELYPARAKLLSGMLKP